MTSTNDNTSYSNCSTISTIDINTKIHSLDIYYNLLSEKLNYYISVIEDFENKYKKLKHNLYLLSVKLDNHINKACQPPCPPPCPPPPPPPPPPVPLTDTNLNWIIERVTKKANNGGTALNGQWSNIKLNKIQYLNNDLTMMSKVQLYGNEIIIDPGIYNIYITTIFYKTGLTQIRFFDKNNNRLIENSLSQFISPSYNSNNSIINLYLYLNIDVNTTYLLQYNAQYKVNNYGLGLSTALLSDETYTRINIIKIK